MYYFIVTKQSWPYIYIYIFIYIYILSTTEKCPGSVFKLFTFTFSASEKNGKLNKSGQFVTSFLNHGTLNKNLKKTVGDQRTTRKKKCQRGQPVSRATKYSVLPVFL